MWNLHKFHVDMLKCASQVKLQILLILKVTSPKIAIATSLKITEDEHQRQKDTNNTSSTRPQLATMAKVL